VRYDQRWSFYNPVRVVSGPGLINEVASYAPEGGMEKVLLVTSPGSTERGLAGRLRELLAGRQVTVLDRVSPNPDIASIEQHRSVLEKENIDFVVGVGGGSVLDTAKALSFLLGLDDPQFSLREHLAGETPLPESPPLYMIAVPTTAGTGSEATPFATIWDDCSPKKYSLAHPDLFPDIALLDPELTLSLPLETTVVTGLDVLSHALESVWNRNASPLSISYAARAIDIVLTALPALVERPRDLEKRAMMLAGSYFGGVCISVTKTALAHSMSYPITSVLGVPHGLACGFTLPALLAYNARHDDGRLQMAAEMSGCGGISGLSERLEDLFEKIGVGALLEKYKLDAEEALALADRMFTPERSCNNICPAGPEEVKAILKASLPPK